jgi:hypothetical protein
MEDNLGEVIILGFKATITGVTAQAANPDWPHSEHKLLVWIDFGGKPVGGTLSFWVSIPVKEYSASEFLEEVKKEGEERLKAIMLKDEADKIKRLEYTDDQEYLNKLAARIRDSLKAHPGIS